MESVKLTQYSHGAGCGCKIAPSVLEKILRTEIKQARFPNLLVGNESKDDAAVYDLGSGQCIISTTDFFMPIVDDAFTFGEVASANALSDIYAMGGKPILALAVLGWPIAKLPVEIAQHVMEGARSVCAKANIPLAGGHSIDSPEPIFGLAVTGIVNKKNLKQNNTAQTGSKLYLTKPIGIGIITTAHKRGLALEDDFKEAVKTMTQLNAIGEEIGALEYVNALTDITGFGLLGHLLEVCEGSGVSAEVEYASIPLLSNIKYYTEKMIYPDNTMRNWQSYQDKVDGIGSESLLTLCDPQTSGGLLVSVDEDASADFESFCKQRNLNIKSFGRLVEKKEKTITIR
ncbi:MAG: selenide, water dikinase SelD [Flammeovirgaceae bacterium]|nr:selenide, water dikinase SelD [Flammeovirgaceae bacterium]